jgi:tetratricopeptide (TPR) repeat protein
MTGTASPLERPPGRIITFFSYKGGTGRSMALANVAWILASSGQRVLMMDWDFEAPGLHRYVHPFLSDPELVESAGLIDFFLKFATAAISVEESNKDWFQPYTDLLNYTRSVDFAFPEVQGKRGYLDLIPAGLQDGQYSVRVNGFNWERFYTAFGGGIFLEAVKQKLRREYDYILIDSRTGVSDTSGVCTVQMPDDLVACFTLNRQSIAGCAAVARSAAGQRRQAKSGAGLRVWPVPTRIEDAEKTKRDRMQSHAMDLFGGLIAHIPREVRERYWGEVAVRYQPFYAYEEILSVFGDRPHATGSMLNSMEGMTRYLTDGAVSRLSPMSEKVRRDGLEGYQAGLSLDVLAPTTDETDVAAIDVALAESVARSGVERFQDDVLLQGAAHPVSGERMQPFTFYLSYANLDHANDEYLSRFLQDVRNELRIQVGNESIAFWDDSRELKSTEDTSSRLGEASRRAGAVLALISPVYVHSEVCLSEFRLFSSQDRPILPVLWVPVDISIVPAELRRIQMVGGVGEIGLRRMIQIRRYKSDYIETVAALVNRMVTIARSRQEPRFVSDPDRDLVRSLAARYAKIREAMPEGKQRTSLMEDIVAEMRKLPAGAWQYRAEFMHSDEPGERLAAIAMMQTRPARVFANWLAIHVDPAVEKPFVGYHAAVALRTAANQLPSEELPAVESSIIKALQKVKGEADSDRDSTLRFALKEVRRRVSRGGTTKDYSKICFVIMPFGKKKVADKEVDFDALYDDIFLPAIGEVTLPEGGKLDPRRTDKDFFTGDIKLEMFQYLEYSRFALADISGLNFNVAYELGVRHRARQAGTAIFRQSQFAPPFDISSIKVFPYEYAPADAAKKSRVLITQVLTESLIRNRLDSPVRLALMAQRESGQIDDLLKQAENEIRKPNWPGAMDLYRAAVTTDPNNPLPRMKLGLLCRDLGFWDEAMEQFTAATVASPSYPEAWREKGIVENKLAQIGRQPLDTDPAPGEVSLRRAIELNPRDFDACASLGGVLKRAKRFPDALKAYEQSLKVSGGHPYPLLNALKLRAQINGRLALSGPDKLALMRAAQVREGQSKQLPAFDKPWCFFDLAEIRLYQGDAKAFLDTAMQGFSQTDEDWQGKTFVDSLRLLLPAADELPGLKEGVAELEKLLP